MANIQKLSYIITSKSPDDPKLKDLLESIKWQYSEGFEKEVWVITEGTSESAKAIGIRRCSGDVVCILASDNLLDDPMLSYDAMELLKRDDLTGVYPAYYSRYTTDTKLSRYFALIGGNDPLAVFLGKADRLPLDNEVRGTHILNFPDSIPTLGDNGFFIKRGLITQSRLDSYYHIDVCEDLRRLGHYRYARLESSIWHRTGDCSILNFFRRRARFGTQHAFNTDRRWHLVGFKDALRLLLFVVSAATLVYPTIRAIKGYLKVRDSAWFLAPMMELLTLLTYAYLTIRLIVIPPSQSLFVPTGGQKA